MFMGNYTVDAMTVVFRYQVLASVRQSNVMLYQHSCNIILMIFQEIHLATGTVNTIQSGYKRLLGKANPIHALQIHGELIYAAGSSLDGSAIKVSQTRIYKD